MTSAKRRIPLLAMRRWTDQHATWQVADKDGLIDVPVEWGPVRHLIVQSRTSDADAYVQGTFVVPSLEGGAGRTFSVTVLCAPETCASWKLAQSADIINDPSDFPWETLNAWDEEALLLEIDDRSDRVFGIQGIAEVELSGDDHPSKHNAAVPADMRAFRTD